VVQLYADGFRDLPLREKTSLAPRAGGHRGRDIFYDQRYRAQPRDARHSRRAIVTHRDGVPIAATLDEIERYTKLFWINTGPVQQPHGAQVRAELLAGGVVGRGRTPRSARGRGSRQQAGETLDPLAGAGCSRCSSSSRRRSHRDQQERQPRPGKDILTASANNLYVGETMADLDGFEERTR
jgi:dipeptidyl-peptidase-3